MNASVYRFTLDIHKPHSGVCLNVKRDDNKSRLLMITLSEGGQPYQIGPECYAVFAAEKPDGRKVFNHCTIEGNRIVYLLTGQTMAVAGRLDCEIKLYGADDALITSPGFDIIVRNVVVNPGEVIESETEVDALTHLISEATTVINESRESNEEAKRLIADLEDKQNVFNRQVSLAANAAKNAQAEADAALAARRGAETAAGTANEAAGNAEAFANRAFSAQRSAENSSSYAQAARDEAQEAAKQAKEYSEKLEIGDVDVPDEQVREAVDAYMAENPVVGAPGKDGQDGHSPTVSVAAIDGGHRVAITDKDGTKSFDVMDGKDGEGSGGGSGTDGVSPVVTVTGISGGHRVTITDKDGTESFDVMDGETGADGRSVFYLLYAGTATGDTIINAAAPVTGGKSLQIGDLLISLKGIMYEFTGYTKYGELNIKYIATLATKGDPGVSATHSWNGTVLTVTSASGTSSADLKGDKGDKGDQGKEGADGYTPVKGTDYFTAADKTEMVNAVIAALPVYGGEVTEV